MVGLDEKDLSIIMHELRSPISTLLSIIDEVKNHLKSQIDVEKSLEKIEGVASYMLSLSNNYLEISKSENACISSVETTFNFMDIIKYVVGIFDFQFNLKNIEFTKQIANADIVVYGDSIKVKQILINLLSNCFKYTPNNGKTSLYVDSRFLNEDVVEFEIIVKDNGIGMSEEYLEKIFTPFKCENEQIIPKGIGLGMCIIQENLKSLNGSIKIDSKVNVGTKVEIKIPLKVDKRRFDFSNKRFLIIDDCLITRKVLENYLGSTDATFDFASTGKEGLKRYIKSKPNYYHAIILDYHVGNQTGDEITKQIRKLKRKDAKKIKIIGISASNYEKDIKKCLEAGMNNFLVKPLNKYNLLNVISN